MTYVYVTEMRHHDLSDDPPKPPPSFVKEIQLMMYGLGDSKRPLEETAKLVERIVLSQLKGLMHAAQEIATHRKQETVAPEDILFCMRTNKTALKRLITYLGIKDEKAVLCKAISELVDVGFEDLVTNRDEPPAVQWRKSRKGYCLDFLKSIGIEESELDMIDDGAKENRLIRADNYSLSLSSLGYEEFHKARCASFSSAHMSSDRFIEWLKYGGVGQTLSSPVAEILIYLAKEAIANLVDMALTIRLPPLLDTTEPLPISPDEIQEVVRRCTYQHTPFFAAFATDYPRNAKLKLFCF